MKFIPTRRLQVNYPQFDLYNSGRTTPRVALRSSVFGMSRASVRWLMRRRFGYFHPNKKHRTMAVDTLCRWPQVGAKYCTAAFNSAASGVKLLSSESELCPGRAFLPVLAVLRGVTLTFDVLFRRTLDCVGGVGH